MFRKILVLVFIVAILLMPSIASAALYDDVVSAGTVDFTSTPQVISFNNVANHLLFVNESTGSSVWIGISDLGWNTNSTVYTMPTISDPTGNTIKLSPSSSIALDFNTDMIGFIGENTIAGNTVQFVLTFSE